MKHLVALLFFVLVGCSWALPKEYEPREGDLLFQSLPHSPLADAIEGVSQSPYSHCGLVAFRVCFKIRKGVACEKALKSKATTDGAMGT